MSDPDQPDRFEFRRFGADLAAAAEAAARGEPAGEDETREVYLLLPDPGVNVKLREGRLELKRLVCERGGLERWRPGDALALPARPERLRAAFSAAGLDWAPDRALDAEGVVGFAAAQPETRAAALLKRRRRWRLGGGLVEHARVELEDGEIETAAAEAETAAETLRLAAALGLGGRNLSWPRFLLERVGGG